MFGVISLLLNLLFLAMCSLTVGHLKIKSCLCLDAAARTEEATIMSHYLTCLSCSLMFVGLTVDVSNSSACHTVLMKNSCTL